MKILICKAHLKISNFKDVENIVIFTTSMNRREAQEIKRSLELEGYKIAFVQDMESLKENGVNGLVKEYVRGYGLSREDERDLIDYFKDWEILRQCCGQVSAFLLSVLFLKREMCERAIVWFLTFVRFHVSRLKCLKCIYQTKL